MISEDELSASNGEESLRISEEKVSVISEGEV